MPNIKSAIKRVKTNKISTLKNQIVKSILKTVVKKFDNEAASGDKESALSSYKLAVKKVDQAVSKGVIKKNTASRKKSQLTKKFNSIGA